jgi:hypothetical protein
LEAHPQVIGVRENLPIKDNDLDAVVRAAD